ncbi:MAG: hypothetical protein ABEJ72_10535, partial [Candidatus Aenigmatarchaeota archaeon]
MEERGYKIFAPEENEPTKDSEVFFNEKMLHNRDISEIAARIFREKIDTDCFTAADPLSGTGIRGFRYSEIADELYLNDANPRAINSIEKGLEENNIEAEVINEDANVFLSEHHNHLHLIDVDPFGPFTPFLDSTARAARYESFVGLTATDNAAPAGSYPTVCRRRYGSEPLKNSFMHETALRIYIKEVFLNFARFDKCFDPRLCFHERHYSRVMGRVTESKKRANQALDSIGYLSYCPRCRWRELERKERCENCGNSDLRLAGPLWTGKFVDQRFTEKMLDKVPEDWKESQQLLERLHGEAEILTPFYD